MSKISCDACAVRHRALCCDLSVEQLARLNTLARHRTLTPGEPILREQEPAPYFANIVSGVVKLSKTMPDGRHQIVGLQFSSDFVGRPYGERSVYAAEAATEVQLCTFSQRHLETLVEEVPSLKDRLLALTLNELDAAREWMLVLGRKTAAEKVASLLLLVARRAQVAHCGMSGTDFASFDLPLSRSEIADYLGLTIETVSRQFTRLKSQGLIMLDRHRRVTVPDMQSLRDASEQLAA